MDGPRGHGLRTGGFTSLGLAVPALGVGIGGTILAKRAKRDFLESSTEQGRADAGVQGERANKMMIGGYAAAGTLTAVGAGLLITDHLRGRRSKLSVVPAAGADHASVVVSGRF